MPDYFDKFLYNNKANFVKAAEHLECDTVYLILLGDQHRAASYQVMASYDTSVVNRGNEAQKSYLKRSHFLWHQYIGNGLLVNYLER